MNNDDPTRLPDDQIEAIRNSLFRGNKIEAIKLYRQATGLGLAEAKAFIDALEPRLREQEPNQFTAAPRKAGCAGMIALVGLTTAIARWMF